MCVKKVLAFAIFPLTGMCDTGLADFIQLNESAEPVHERAGTEIFKVESSADKFSSMGTHLELAHTMEIAFE
jgi:hypothetical protein